MVYRVQDNINQVQTNLPPHILATKGGIITRAGVCLGLCRLLPYLQRYFLD